jgi:AhpD family alkylhydroperoxidase
MVNSEKQPTKPRVNSFFKALPDVAKSFDQLHSTIISDGALPQKTKELIAVGISVAIRCQPCIQTHIPEALKTGNSCDEILEAISVGLLIGGGPSSFYASEATDLLNSLSADKKKE